MDNKINKKRLSDFLSYEWIAVIIVAVVAILLWELLYTFTAVRLTTGQSFKFYYDENVSGENDDTFSEALKGGVFSYDIRKIESEKLLAENDVLYTRVATSECDAIFTDDFKSENSDGHAVLRVNTLIDRYSFFTFEEDQTGIIYKAKEYLSGFLKEEGADPAEYVNLDENKIAANFNVRANKRIYANDLRTGNISLADECERIKKLCEDVKYLQKIIDYDKTLAEEDSIFYSYARYSQSIETGEADGETQADPARKYGLNLTRLGDKAKKIFYLSGEKEGDVLALLFDFTSKQPDLQFESIALVNFLVKNYADFADSL